jgi:hypothetical protein
MADGRWQMADFYIANGRWQILDFDIITLSNHHIS